MVCLKRFYKLEIYTSLEIFICLPSDFLEIVVYEVTRTCLVVGPRNRNLYYWSGGDWRRIADSARAILRGLNK